MSGGGTCDEFGFNIDEHLVEAYKKHCLATAEKRLQMREQWGVLTQEIKAKASSSTANPTSRKESIELAGEKTREARRILRGPVVQGIPGEFRPFVWPLMCGVEKAKAARGEHIFPSLLQRAEGKERNHELELDLDRTFPGHPLLDKESAFGREGVASLHRVLNSYALYNPAVGYCQSMNFIVGILLIMDVMEEDAFWMISHISDSLLPNHFAPPMLGAQVDSKLFCILMRRHLPQLSTHLDSIGFDPGLICGQWFLCIFCNKMPCETVCRIWDVVFCKGPQTIFQVALAMFKLCEKQIMEVDDMGMAIHILRDFELSLFDADALIECAVLEFASVGDVGKMRDELLPTVKKEYQEHRRKIESYRMQENVKKGTEMLKSAGGKLSQIGAGLGSTIGSFASEVRAQAESGELGNKSSSLLSSASSLFSFASAPKVGVVGKAKASTVSQASSAKASEALTDTIAAVGTTSSNFWNHSPGKDKDGEEGAIEVDRDDYLDPPNEGGEGAFAIEDKDPDSSKTAEATVQGAEGLAAPAQEQQPDAQPLSHSATQPLSHSATQPLSKPEPLPAEDAPPPGGGGSSAEAPGAEDLKVENSAAQRPAAEPLASESKAEDPKPAKSLNTDLDGWDDDFLLSEEGLSAEPEAGKASEKKDIGKELDDFEQMLAALDD